MVVVLHAETTSLGNCLELMVRQTGELAAGGAKGVVELVVRIIHLITTEYCLQAAFIEGSIMSHKGQALNQRLYLRPHFWKDGSIICILTAEAVNLRTPVVIVVWFRLNEGVEGIYNLSVPDNNYAH